MNTENVVYLHNGILLSYLKGGYNEFCIQMNGISKYHPGSGKSDPKPYVCYVLTNKQILGKELQNYQNTEFKEDKKPKGPITLVRKKKAITGVGKALGGNEIGRGRGIT